MKKALNHDYTERFIGDIKTPVKYANKELRQMLSTVEEKDDRYIHRRRDSRIISADLSS